MIRFFIFCLAVTAFSFQCKHKQHKVFTQLLPQKSKLNYQLSIDSAVIPFSVIDTPDYCLWQVQSFEDSAYMFCYNRNKNTMGVYNLDAPRKIWETSIYNYATPSELEAGEITNIYFHHIDTLVFQHSNFIGLANRDSFYSRVVVNEMTNPNKIPAYIFRSDASPILWDSEKKGYWAQGYSGLYDKNKSPERFFGTPVEAFISADSTKKNIEKNIPVTYPPRYKSECLHGYSVQVYRTLGASGKRIYSFPAESDIYIFDPITQKVDTFPAKSVYDTLPFACMDKKDVTGKNGDLLMEKFILSPHYQRVIYDSYRNVYYRLFEPAMPQKNKDGYYNTLDDKKLVLMIFDSDFKIIGEILLPTPKYIPEPTVGKKGLYFVHVQRKTNEQKYSIYNFTFAPK